jgi:transposase
MENKQVILMESAAKIRRLVLRDGRSIRWVSRTTGLSRNTIKKYLKDANPPSYKRTEPAVRHKLRGFEDRLRKMYGHDQSRARRERRTSVKLYEQLVLEGYTGSYYPVCRFIRTLRSAGLAMDKAFIPLQFSPGDALQFDWSEEHVVLGGLEQRIKVAHFRLCHSRKPFVMAYPNECQEMVLDAFVHALNFYGGVPRRAIIDNPKTMVTFVSRSKDRVFHPRFLACMNHYVMEPVACTPASGWEKGQVENQVQHIRGRLFTPKLSFDDLDSLNAWLHLRCDELGARPHPEQKDKTIDAVFDLEFTELRPVGQAFDGYVEKVVRVRSTCLVQYETNRYSVPAQYAGKPVSLRTYANRIVVVCNQKVIAEHRRYFTKNMSYFEPWHYVGLLSQKPGALRDGAPFAEWQLPDAMLQIKALYMDTKGGDRDFVELLVLAQEHSIGVIERACELAVDQKTVRLPAIINLINQLIEPAIDPLPHTQCYPKLTNKPVANCKRYEALYQMRAATV